uniref:Translocase of inner mitochondrial membrane domain containing 1 n=1 Tax=Coturnix japonica TaxID=93934 RepID=A0A8C2SSH7_COTJA
MAEGLGAGGTFGRPTPPPQTGWERLSELWRREIPAGGLVMIAQKLTGETLQEKRNRERREQYEQKLAEWQARLSVTEDLGRMESDGLGQSQTENIF